MGLLVGDRFNPDATGYRMWLENQTVIMPDQADRWLRRVLSRLVF